jgi:DNA-binding Lrp family transcriptional regulator
MTRAYVRINTVIGKEIAVRDPLRKLSGVVCADITAGEQDVLCLVESNSVESIFNVVISKIRALEGVQGTMTNLIVDR